MMNMSNPRQITPTGGSPNCAVGWPQDTALNAATATFPRLDATQPLDALAHDARARRREATAIEARAWQAATEKCRDYAQDVPPSVFKRLDELGPEAMREVNRTIAVGERIGYQAGFEAACTLLKTTQNAAYAAGQADMVTALHAEQLRQLDAENRALSASLAQGVPYPELCELRGEPERAERARQLYAERGIA